MVEADCFRDRWKIGLAVPEYVKTEGLAPILASPGCGTFDRLVRGFGPSGPIGVPDYRPSHRKRFDDHRVDKA